MSFQGDVSILKLADEKKDLVFKPLPKDGFVVAYGEKTNHNHRVEVADREAIVEIAEDENGAYIKVLKGSAKLTHQEHAVRTLDMGNWYVGKKWEYDPVSKFRRVSD